MTEVKPYKHSRHWAVYLNGILLAVCVYKKGAYAVKEAIDNLNTRKANS